MLAYRCPCLTGATANYILKEAETDYDTFPLKEWHGSAAFDRYAVEKSVK